MDSAKEQVIPVPSGSMLTLVTLPSSTSIEKRLHLTFPKTLAKSSSKSIALVKSPQVSAKSLTFPPAFWLSPHAPITKGSLTATQKI